MYMAELRDERRYCGAKVKSIFNYGTFNSPHRLPNGTLLHVNEWSLTPDNKVIWSADKLIHVLIPIYGDLSVDTVHGRRVVPVGELLIFWALDGADTVIESLNKDCLNGTFMQLAFASSTYSGPDMYQGEIPVLKTNLRNSMIPIESEGCWGFELFFGAFIGKSESKLDAGSGLAHQHFVFVISGTMEVEDRLLNAGDSLCLHDYDEIEFACLAGNSLLMLVKY